MALSIVRPQTTRRNDDATSVTFTVVSDGDFDEPGSTTTFQAITNDVGSVSLQQVAQGRTGNEVLGVAFRYFQPSYLTWQDQAQRLRNATAKYGRGHSA